MRESGDLTGAKRQLAILFPFLFLLVASKRAIAIDRFKLLAAQNNQDCGYGAVGSYYLKHSWEDFMQKQKRYSFIVDTPNILGNFLIFVGQHQLAEKYLIFRPLWSQTNVYQNFRPHGNLDFRGKRSFSRNEDLILTPAPNTRIP